jgi:superfamily I DNA and/or RNA helicase
MKELVLSPADIVVLTPYRANLRALGKRFRKEESLRDIVCSTFDGFQGREAQIVVLALCVTQETGPACVAAERSLNVAITRQRSSLLIFGDIATTEKIPRLFRFDDDYNDLRASTEWNNQKVFREVFWAILQSKRIVNLAGNPAADPDSYWNRLKTSTQIL